MLVCRILREFKCLVPIKHVRAINLNSLFCPLSGNRQHMIQIHILLFLYATHITLLVGNESEFDYVH